MDFTAILDYQKVEGVIEQLNEKFQKSTEYRAYAVSKKAYNDVVAEFKDLQQKLDDYNKEYQKILAEYETVSKNLDAAMTKAKDADTIEDVSLYLDKLNTLSERLEKSETTCEKLLDQITKARKNYDTVRNDGVAKQNLKNTAKEAYDKEKGILDANVAKCNAALKQIAGTVPPEAMGLYNKVKAANVKFPYIVKQDKGKEYCLGCSKFIGSAVYSLEKPGDYIECPECGRILFL